MKSIMLSMLFGSYAHMFWGMLVAVLAEALKAHGITVDQAGLTNDIVAAVGALVSAAGHVQVHKELAKPSDAGGKGPGVTS